MDQEIKLNDIADELLILNKYTIDTLFKLENCTDCIALYVFYYKTSKWQKTNTIKANDTYVKKSLKWGEDKVRRTKKILKENGLIDIVQSRKDGKICGWYIKVSYLVQQKKSEDIKIKVETINNTQVQELAESRNGNEEVNALKEYIKCLEKELEMLKNNNTNNDLLSLEESEFENLWKTYKKKSNKANSLKAYIKTRKGYKSSNITYKPVSYEEIEQGLNRYNSFLERNNTERRFTKDFSTWLNGRCWEDDYEEKEFTREQGGYAF